MQLDQQLQVLDESGLRLDEGVTIQDLLHSWGRDAYERKPFDLIFAAMGSEVEREPWGNVCSSVWHFDTECIYMPGDYVQIAKRLALLSGDPHYLTDISDQVDLAQGSAWLKYTVSGIVRFWTADVHDDWVDMMVLFYLFDDLARDGHQFYCIPNGQTMTLFYLDAGAAQKLGKLTNGNLKPVGYYSMLVTSLY